MAKQVFHTKIDEYDESHRNRRNSEGDEAMKVAPPKIEIEGLGIFPLYGINTVEKDWKIISSETRNSSKFVLHVNKGTVPSNYFPRVDIELHYDTEVKRDKVYNDIKKAIAASGVEIYKA